MNEFCVGPGKRRWMVARCARVAAVALGVAASLPLPAAPLPGGEPGKPAPKPLDIRPDPGAKWGASIQDVEKVLRAAAGELWPLFPGRTLPPILVEPKGGPIVLFQRGAQGEIRVRLDTGETYWAQYTFQFAHEFCHILCGYDEDENPSKWFEESVCETASLFVLRRSAVTWKTAPPYPHWKDFASHLKSYADERLEKSKPPEGKTFLAWYRENAEALVRNPTDRPRNNIVAGQLLPLFEKAPERWESVSWLNVEKLDKTYDFRKYLEAWHRNCPEKHRAFVREIGRLFEIDIKPVPATGVPGAGGKPGPG